MSEGVRRPRDDDSETDWVLAQLAIRLGGKVHVLKALRGGNHSADIDEIQNKTLLNTMTDRNLLVKLLSPLWQEASKLSLVCKQFYKAIRNNPSFWMPGVKDELVRRGIVPPLHINPFHQLPAHVWIRPRYPWHAFLQWMFVKHVIAKVPSARKTAFGAVVFYHSVYGCLEHTKCAIKYTAPGDNVLNYAHLQEANCIYVHVDQHTVFYDGVLVLNGRHWCGAVQDTDPTYAIDSAKLVPQEKFGFYRE